QQGWLTLVDQTVDMTTKGRDRAEQLVRKRRLAERLLLEVVGIDWARVPSNAQRWELAISDDAEDLITRLLGDPETCPHGNRIPRRTTERRVRERPSVLSLDAVPVGATVRVERMSESIGQQPDLVSRMLRDGMVPGSDVCVVARFEGTTIFQIS